MNKNLLFAFIVFISVCSCDCFKNVNGRVIDTSTLQPVDSVRISMYNKNHKLYYSEEKYYTDSSGTFNFLVMTGCFFSIPKLNLNFHKEGYEPAIEKYRSCCTDNDTIKLKPLDN